MLRISLVLMSILLLTSCSDQADQAITKNEESSAGTGNNPALIEEQASENEQTEKEVHLEFPLNEGVVSLNVSQLPILNSYLEVNEDKEEALENMQLRELADTKNNLIYLLEFACQKGYCSYLLLKRGEESFSYLVADSAKFKKAEISPDSAHILLLFSRDILYDDATLFKEKLMVMNIDEWAEVPLLQSEETILDFTWPILHAEWVNDSAIQLSLPAIPAPTAELIYKWNQGERKTNTMEISLLSEDE